VLLAVSTSYPLRASTAYAYSMDDVGLGFSNATLVGDLTSFASNSSSFSNFGTSTHSGPLDPAETTVGPGPFPGQNSFGPEGQVGLGYSRADTEITSTDIDALGGENVAEAYLTAPGNASDLAYDKFGFGVTPTVANQPISITIFADPNMQVTTTGDGVAEADIALAVNIYNADGQLLLAWFPDGNPLGDFTLNAGSVSGVEDPFTLNADIDCSGNCDKSYAPGGINEWTLSYEGAGPYYVTVGWEEGVNVAIPEPASLALTGGALILLGLARKRSRRRDSRDLPPEGPASPPLSLQ
jgi:hypothetical protein